MPTELKGKALLDYYREAVQVTYGRAVADRSILRYEYGWYYEKLPILDGAVDAMGTFHSGYLQNSVPYRAKEFREMADELLKRAEEAQDE